jgi:transposase-like protein
MDNVPAQTSTGRTVRKFSPEFKFNVVLESFITGNVSATAARHDIHITQLNAWRRILKQKGTDLFNLDKSVSNAFQKRIDQLEKIIGRITVENQILKKTEELIT